MWRLASPHYAAIAPAPANPQVHTPLHQLYSDNLHMLCSKGTIGKPPDRPSPDHRREVPIAWMVHVIDELERNTIGSNHLAIPSPPR